MALNCRPRNCATVCRRLPAESDVCVHAKRLRRIWSGCGTESRRDRRSKTFHSCPEVSCLAWRCITLVRIHNYHILLQKRVQVFFLLSQIIIYHTNPIFRQFCSVSDILHNFKFVCNFFVIAYISIYNIFTHWMMCNNETMNKVEIWRNVPWQILFT